MTINQLPIVNGLWIGNSLSPLEVLTIKSFLHHGYSFRLWVYDEVLDVPQGTIIEDANSIITVEDVFSYSKANKYGHGKGSFAGFSDIFRYKLLYEHGGIWVDMDITCLKPMNHEVEYIFRFHKQLGVVGNYMQCPAKSALMLFCYERAIVEVDSGNTDWLLPIRILNEGIKRFELSGYVQKFSNEDSFPIIFSLLKGKMKDSANWSIIHWMNEEFRRMGISKNEVLEKSALKELYVKHDIHHKVKGEDVFLYVLKMNKIYYSFVNLISRFNWVKNRVLGG